MRQLPPIVGAQLSSGRMLPLHAPVPPSEPTPPNPSLAACLQLKENPTAVFLTGSWGSYSHVCQVMHISTFLFCSPCDFKALDFRNSLVLLFTLKSRRKVERGRVSRMTGLLKGFPSVDNLKSGKI